MTLKPYLTTLILFLGLAGAGAAVVGRRVRVVRAGGAVAHHHHEGREVIDGAAVLERRRHAVDGTQSLKKESVECESGMRA